MGNKLFTYYSSEKRITSKDFHELFNKFSNGNDKIPQGDEIKFLKSLCYNLGLQYNINVAKEILLHIDPNHEGLDLMKSKEFFLGAIEDSIKEGNVSLSVSMMQSIKIDHNNIPNIENNNNVANNNEIINNSPTMNDENPPRHRLSIRNLLKPLIRRPQRIVQKIEPQMIEEKQILIKWFWKGDNGWNSYNVNVCELIEEEYNNPKNNKIVKVDEQRFVDLNTMQQKRYDINTAVRAIKREGNEDKGDIWTLNAYGSIHIISKNISDALEKGNKIILPPKILDKIMQDSNMGPFFFSIENSEYQERVTIASVLEFNAPEDTVYIPDGIMNRLLLSDGEKVNISLVQIPPGEYVKLRPHNPEFSELEDPVEVLSSVFGYNYSSLSVDEIITLTFNGIIFDFTVLDTKPGNSINIIGQTLKIDFEEASVHKEEPQSLKDGDSIKGTVEGSLYQYYKFFVPKESKNKVIKVVCVALTGDPDLYISHSNKKPDPVDNAWSAVKTGGEEILIETDDPNRRNDVTYYVSVRGYKKSSEFEITFSLLDVSEVIMVKPTEKEEKEEEEEEKPNNLKCPTCRHWVPEFSFSRHEVFCSRNSWRCSDCGIILKLQFKDDHWHCPKCKLVSEKNEHFHCDLCENFPGMPFDELEKHKDIYHTDMKCKCEQEYQLEDLIVHQKFDCVLRKVPCKW
eukprot:TRINITY_DN7622_c0_g1_i1.p1 TRINITY_DN7622_c0_g1~~TRINITY_DN7622_c0_g1_i1.p1  ORF type:complete len:690 (+),score=184.51 TRINITY_DN7622_c0_g1_i1:22-2070(+)